METIDKEIYKLGVNLGEADYLESAESSLINHDSRPTQIDSHPTFIEDQVRDENLFSRNAERFGKLFGNADGNADLDSGEPNGDEIDKEIKEFLISKDLYETYVNGYESGWRNGMDGDDNVYADEEGYEDYWHLDDDKERD